MGHNAPRVHCYILTGGRSTRMGTSKAALFLDRVAAAARPAFDRVIAVQRHGAETTPIETIFEDEHEGEGPIFAVATALRHARTRAFILAVDYPFVTPDVLAFIRDDGRVPWWNGRPQPLCARWEFSYLHEIEEHLARGRFDLRALREEEMIPESLLRARFPGEPLMNVNTPEERWKAERIDGLR